MFLNLRGDAMMYKKQTDYLTQISNIVFVITNTEFLEQDNCVDFMQPLHQSQCTIVLLLTNQQHNKDPSVMKSIMKSYANKIGDNIKRTKYITTIKNGKQRNAADIKHDVRQTISKIMVNKTGSTIGSFCSDLKALGVIYDEENPKCTMGKIFAKTLLSHFDERKVINIKNDITPLQGELWQKWSKLQKQQNKSGQKMSIYEQDRIKKEMNLIRERQVEICNNLSPVMMDFISFLIHNIHDQELMKYSVQWLKMALDAKSRSILPALISKYHKCWTAFKKAKDDQKVSDLKTLKDSVQSAEQELADASFGYEHFIRELGQLYEAVVSDGGANVTKETKSKIEILPLVVAKLLRLGNPFEIMDGDAANIPLSWVRSVLSNLKNLIGDKKLLALSVLGIQSSGKSTLLNTMFGLQFAVSAGRCTRGVFMQLVSVDKSVTDCPYDYVLVIDTEGLRAPELGLQKFDHDNELATLVIGMGDITIMNVKGENTAEVKDVLQIAVHAFLRLKLVNQRLNLSQSCIFIHQNVPAVNARDKMLHGRQKLVENLDSMTMEAALQEEITDICAFNQVINFNSQDDVWYFSDLWHGDPPMAPANPGYSEKVLEVKNCIMHVISKRKHTFLTISNSIQHIEDLWNGILADDFVFSFRNSLEVQAYNMMESKYQELAWSLEQFTLEWVRKKAAIELGKCKSVEDLEGCSMQTSSLLNQQVCQKRECIKEELEKFFDSHNLKDILIKWKQNKLNALMVHSEELLNRAKQDITEMKEKERVDLVQRTKQTDLEREINYEAIKLADQIKGTKPTETQTRTLFEEMYVKWINALAARSTTYSIPVETEVESVLFYRLYKDSASLNNEIARYPIRNVLRISQLEGSLRAEDITKQHISIAKKFLVMKAESWDTCAFQAIDVTNGIFRKIDQYLKNLVHTDTKFNPAYVNEILNFIITDIEKHNSEKSQNFKFSLLPPFRVKVAVHVLRYATKIFKSINENYDRNHSTKAKLEAYRETAWQLFRDTVDQKTEEVKAASMFCEIISKVIKTDINTRMPTAIQREILSRFSHLKYHLMVDIMDDLARKGNFTLYKNYISDPHTFASRWLTDYTNEKIFGINENGQSWFFQIAITEIRKLVSCIEKSVAAATTAVNKGIGLKIKLWVEKFEEHARTEINLQSGTLSHVKDIQVCDFSNFQRLISERLHGIESELEHYYKMQTASSVTWKGTTPYQGAMDKLWGCTAHCPFCHEPCQNTSKDHISRRENHRCIQHRPSGIGGDRWETDFRDYRKGQLVIESCNYKVQWKDIRIRLGNSQYYNATDYKSLVPEWDIAPSSDMFSKSDYWMWFMAEYRYQLKDMHRCELPRIPDSLLKITKESARQSLRKSSN